MIKANELRIGNLVDSIDSFPGGRKGKGIVVDLEILKEIVLDRARYAPILLTPEWLERCGKACNDIPGWEYRVSVGALNWYFRWNTEWYSELGGIYLDSRVKYLHQLQNLYFALTGNELTINASITH